MKEKHMHSLIRLSFPLALLITAVTWAGLYALSA